LEEISGYFNWTGCTQEIYLSAVSRANQELAELHLELVSRNRRIQDQQAILQAICGMQEALPAAVGIGRALEKVVVQLAAALPHRRLMCFLIHQREGVVEGGLKEGESGRLQRVVLPLEDRMEDRLRSIQPREQFSLIEKAVLRLGQGLEVAAEIAAALRSANLVVLPLEAGGLTIGQILLEMESSRQASEETISLLRQYARAAFVALERILLFEALEQQADDLARMARQGQETQKRLYQAERLASVGRLAAGAAHEINNPLAAISAQAQLMLRRAETDKDKNSLGAIVDQCNRISKIISDLMGFARPAEPRIEPTPHSNRSSSIP
jgi:C4-dicarboxylate-specific signal transduction histidine kinase